MTTQVSAQIVTFLAAGYETTANALAFTVYNIAACLKAEDRLLKEIDAFGRDAVPNFEDLDKVQAPPYDTDPGTCLSP